MARARRTPTAPTVAVTAPAVVPGLPRLGSAEFLARVQELVRAMTAPQTSDAAHDGLDELRRAFLGLPAGTDLAGVDPDHRVLVVFRDAVSIRARRRPAWFLDLHAPQ